MQREHIQALADQPGKVGRQERLLDLAGQQQVLVQPGLADLLGVQGRIIQHHGHLDGQGRQHFQVFAPKALPRTHAVQLDHAQAALGPAQQRHAQERVHVEQ